MVQSSENNQQTSSSHSADFGMMNRLIELLMPQLPPISLYEALPQQADLVSIKHVVFIVPPVDTEAGLDLEIPGRSQLLAVLERKQIKLKELAKKPQWIISPSGALWVYWAFNKADSCFEQQTLLRKALLPLLDEKPIELAVIPCGNTIEWREQVAKLAAYVILVNSLWLYGKFEKSPNIATKPLVLAGENKLERLSLFGVNAQFKQRLTEIEIRAKANVLARRLSVLPANVLNPLSYRRFLVDLANHLGWFWEEFTIEDLQRLGAGAFLAVSQGSADQNAAIVHLRYTPGKEAREHDDETTVPRIVLVGKGICFDSGGLHVKPARYMAGMHEDMNGSAVVLSLLLAASELKLSVIIDAWFAIAENDLSATAYRPGDVIVALNGDKIEIVHTDAEGRLVLADTLSLALQPEPSPNLVVDFATLTGSMITALGNRYAGIFANQSGLATLAVEAGKQSGERVCIFPADHDYAEELESQVADIKQCILAGEADHILATCFLSRFVGNRAWVHVDLSASTCKGGLAAVGSETTGFGVLWGVSFLILWLQQELSEQRKKV